MAIPASDPVGDGILAGALVPGLWLENSFIVSLMACMVLIPETLWSVSYFGRLLRLPRVTGLAD
jgi:hypothetical protein